MNLKKSLIYILMIITVISLNGCTTTNTDELGSSKITVAVSVVPEETFVKAVAGDLINVVTMIPPGNSPTNYQPTTKQMTALSDSDIYFGIGVPTEISNVLPKVKDFNDDIKIVHLDEKVGEIYEHRYFSEEEHIDDHDEEEHTDDHDEEEHNDDHDEEEHNDDHDEEEHNEQDEEHNHSGKDPHIWLSPKRVKVMIEVIKDELVTLDPDNKDIYEKNASSYIAKLDEVDKDIKEILSGVKKQSFIIYHPSFGYFADDYGLNMVTIEEEGKEATARKLKDIIDFAKKENIKFIFYQQEFDSSQAEIIANEIGGATIKVDSLSKDYIDNLKTIADEFKKVLK